MATLNTNSTLNGGSITLVIYEDTNSDGVADNIETVTLSGGSETHSVSSLSDTESNTHWIYVDARPASETSRTLLTQAELQFTTVPTAPSNLNAVVQSHSQIDLSWTDNSSGSGQEDEFRIERRESGGTFSQIATVGTDVTTYQDTGLSDGTEYDYRVRACNSAGCSSYSNTATEATYAYVNVSADGSASGTGTARGIRTRSASADGQASGTGDANISAVFSVSATGSAAGTGTARAVRTRSVTADGEASGTGTAVVVRTRGAAASGQASGTGDATITRTRSATADGQATGTGTALATEIQTRKPTITADGEFSSDAELSEVFPSQSSAELDFSLITDPVLGFASEWVEETDDPFGEEGTALTAVFDIRFATPFDVRIQYSESDDNTADYTTDAQTIETENQVLSWPEIGDPGYYRIIISNMRPADYLRAITWGPTRY